MFRICLIKARDKNIHRRHWGALAQISPEKVVRIAAMAKEYSKEIA
jgi:hypothetical protein